MSPNLDIVRAPFSNWDKGKIAARQSHAVRVLQDPNANLFPQGRTESAHGPEMGAMGSTLLSRVAKSADA